MRGEYASIHSAIVDDSDFKALSPEAKVCWYTLRLLLGASGIDLLRASLSVLEDVTGTGRECLRLAMQELVDGEWLIAEGDVLWLRNVLRFNPNMKVANEKHRIAIERHLSGLPKSWVVNAFAAYYRIDTPFPDTPTEGLSDTYAKQDKRTNGQTEDGSDSSLHSESGASADVENHDRDEIGELHQLVREGLHGGEDTEEASRSHSVLARNLIPALDPAEIRDGLEGLIELRDGGKIPEWEDGFGLRQAMRWRVDGRQLWDVAVEHRRGLTAPPPRKRTRTSEDTMTPLGSLIDRKAG